MPAASRHRHRLPRWLGAESSNRRRGRHAVPVHLTLLVPRIASLVTRASDCGGRLPLRVQVEQVYMKKSFVNVSGRLVKMPSSDWHGVCIQDAHAADEHRHLRSGQRQHVRPIHQQLLRRSRVPVSEVVAEPVCGRFEHGEGVHVGLLLRRVGAPRREGNLHVVPPAFFAASSRPPHTRPERSRRRARPACRRTASC